MIGNNKNRKRKFFLLLLIFIIISCSSKEKKGLVTGEIEELIELKVTDKKEENKVNLTFDKIQDSLRTVLLNLKPNNNLKSSLLQELYIRGLVKQVNDHIIFKIPFNLHSFDCGAPDCYSTDLTFRIPVTNPIEFPKEIKFNLSEYGCGIDNEISKNGTFKLIEQSLNYINYHSKEEQSNLVILGETRELFYFADSRVGLMKVYLIKKMVEEYNDEDPDAIVPYQSTIMTTNGYKNFINNEKKEK